MFGTRHPERSIYRANLFGVATTIFSAVRQRVQRHAQSPEKPKVDLRYLDESGRRKPLFVIDTDGREVPVNYFNDSNQLIAPPSDALEPRRPTRVFGAPDHKGRRQVFETEDGSIIPDHLIPFFPSLPHVHRRPGEEQQ